MIHIYICIQFISNSDRTLSLESLSKDGVPLGLEIKCIRIHMYHKITLSLISLQPTFQKI